MCKYSEEEMRINNLENELNEMAQEMGRISAERNYLKWKLGEVVRELEQIRFRIVSSIDDLTNVEETQHVN